MNPELRDLTAKWTSYPPLPYTDDPNNLFEIEVVSGNGNINRVTLTRLQAAEVAKQIGVAPQMTDDGELRPLKSEAELMGQLFWDLHDSIQYKVLNIQGNRLGLHALVATLQAERDKVDVLLKHLMFPTLDGAIWSLVEGNTVAADTAESK